MSSSAWLHAGGKELDKAAEADTPAQWATFSEGAGRDKATAVSEAAEAGANDKAAAPAGSKGLLGRLLRSKSGKVLPAANAAGAQELGLDAAGEKGAAPSSAAGRKTEDASAPLTPRQQALREFGMYLEPRIIISLISIIFYFYPGWILFLCVWSREGGGDWCVQAPVVGPNPNTSSLQPWGAPARPSNASGLWLVTVA